MLSRLGSGGSREEGLLGRRGSTNPEHQRGNAMRIAKLRPAVAVAWLFAFVLLNWISVVPGFAQTTSCAPTGNCTSTDSLGNTYTFNAASISTTGSTVIPVAQRTPTGATQLASYTVSPAGSSGLFNASSANA